MMNRGYCPRCSLTKTCLKEEMMKTLIAGAFAIAILATPAVAAGKYYVVSDDDGNCSVTEMASEGQKVLGAGDGYDTADAAGAMMHELAKDKSVCKDIVN